MRTMKMIWANDQSNPNGCVVCGKTLSTNKYAVHVIDGGASVLHPEDEAIYASDPDGGDMDWHYLGSECAKKFLGFAVKQ